MSWAPPESGTVWRWADTSIWRDATLTFGKRQLRLVYPSFAFQLLKSIIGRFA